MKQKKEKNIRITEKGTFRVRFTLFGINVDKTFKSLNEAKAFRNQKTNEINRMHKEGIVFEKHDITFGEAFNEMLANQIDDGNEIEESNYYQFKKQTIDNYKKIFKNHLSSLKDIPLKDLTVKLIDNIINIIPKTKNGKNSNVQYRTKSVIDKIIKYAENSKYISIFPKTYGINVKKYGSTKNILDKDNYIEEDTLISIVNNINQLSEKNRVKLSNEDISFIFQLFFYTGLRCGEARGLMVKDFCVDEYKGVKRFFVKVERQMLDGKQEISNLKSRHETRIAYVKEEVFKVFLNFFKTKKYTVDNYVFDFLDDGCIISRQKISRMLKKTILELKEKGILDKDVYSDLSPQDLRVSNTRYLKNIGSSGELRAAIQGHTVSTQNAYYETNTDDINEIFGYKK